MGDNTTEYAITADPSGFTAGMEKVAAASKEASKQIEGHFAALGNVFGKLTGAIAGMTALIAGGAAFKEAIGQSAAWAGEAKKLSMQFGQTTEKASVMMVAMRHLGLDSETVTMAAGKMAKQISTNGQAFDKLGVAVKDVNGQYRPTMDIMGEVNQKLKDIKNPIEQNIAGTQIYGKSWNEVRGLLKLTTEEIQKAEQKTRDLGLLVGEDGVAQAKKYKESINDMKLVMTSIEVQLGSAVMPAFVKIGSWLSGIGPAAGKVMGAVMESFGGILGTVGEVVDELWRTMQSGFSEIGNLISEVMGTDSPGALELFSNALKVVEIAFVGLKVAVRIALDFIKGMIEAMVASGMRMATTLERALHLDVDGAKRAWSTGTAALEDIERKHLANMVAIAEDGRNKLDEIILRGPKAKTAVKDKDIGGGPTYDFDKDTNGKEQSRMASWEELLAIDKDAFERQQQLAGTMQEFGKARERDFWKNILDTNTLFSIEKIQANRKYLGLEHDLRKEAFDSEVAGEKAKLEDFHYNFNERLAIVTRIYADMKSRYGADSKEAKAAMGEISKEQRKLAEQTMATNKIIADSTRNKALAEIEFAQQDAYMQVSLRQISTGKLLEMEEGFEAKRYQIKLHAMQEEEAALQTSPDRNPLALATLHAQIEELERQHQLKLQQIKSRATIEQNKSATEMYGSMQSGLQRVIAGTLQGSMKLRDIFKSLFGVVVSAVTEMLAKTAAQWAMNLILEKALSKASALSQISANAGIAGAAATASAAAIPLYGWSIAPEAGLAASAAAMAFMPMASARGGFDIPAGINPVTQLHEREMVLPQAQADAVRDMADGGGGGGAPINVTIHAADGESVRRLLLNNKTAVADAIKAALRDFRR